MVSVARIVFVIGLILILITHIPLLQKDASMPADKSQQHAMLNMAAALMMLPDSGLGRVLMRQL